MMLIQVRTAEAIGRKINLMLSETKAMVAKRRGKSIDEILENEFKAVVVHGEQVDNLTDTEWDNIFWKDEIIFARTSPKHKLEIVRRAQSMGHIVGVTGDGVNDSPALKKADLGIAMNISGSDVSKEAASMILLDDNFASTVQGIEEGRLIFINLKKSIQYTISHIFPEVVPNLLYVIVPIPLPLSAILILVIDLGFELIAALSFAWDPAESAEGLMKLPPRKPVTLETCNIFRARALRRQRSRFDEEAGVIIPLEDESKLKQWLFEVRQWFTRRYWADKFENTGAEVLVDGPVLSWAYLEIGVIESIGSLVAFFVVMNKRGINPRDAHIMQKGNGPPTHYFNSDGKTYKGITGPEQADILAEAQSMCKLSSSSTIFRNRAWLTPRSRLLVHNDNANVQPLRLQNTLLHPLGQIHVRQPRHLLLHPRRRLPRRIHHLHARRRSRIQNIQESESAVLVNPDGVRVCHYRVCESEDDYSEKAEADSVEPGYSGFADVSYD
jgi:sodium/potassium-transporting ATPase subunit alpha